MLALFAVSIGLSAPRDAGAGQVQYGLRLSSVVSMQWLGTDLYLESERRSVARLSSGRILEAWPGPARGTFMIHSERGLGILLGSDLVIAAEPKPQDALLRSSRPDVLWTGFTVRTPGGPRMRIQEWRAGGLGRELVNVPGELTDFDLSKDGALVILPAHGSPLYIDQAGRSITLTVPPNVGSPERVMLTLDGREVALVSTGQLCRTSIAGSGSWKCNAFDPATHAVVRHAYSGRPKLEPRFRP